MKGKKRRWKKKGRVLPPAKQKKNMFWGGRGGIRWRGGGKKGLPCGGRVVPTKGGKNPGGEKIPKKTSPYKKKRGDRKKRHPAKGQ